MDLTFKDGHSEANLSIGPEAYAFFSARTSMIKAFSAWIQTGADPALIEAEVTGTANNLKALFELRHA